MFKTYEIGLQQAKAYRILKRQTKEALLPYDLSDIEWSILGLLSTQERTTANLAAELAVKKPFINKVCGSLVSKALIYSIDHESDGRSFYYSLTKKGESAVKNIEKILIKKVGSLIQPYSVIQLNGYVKTLQKIIKNDPNPQ